VKGLSNISERFNKHFELYENENGNTCVRVEYQTNRFYLFENGLVVLLFKIHENTKLYSLFTVNSFFLVLTNDKSLFKFELTAIIMSL
jgi:hypothetical protein